MNDSDYLLIEYVLIAEDRAARIAQQYYCCDGRDCQCGGIANEQAEEECPQS